jgi:ATP-dependent helicase HrpB
MLKKPPPMELPVDSLLPEVVDALRDGDLVLEAPPGAGKTTRLPAALLAAGYSEVLVLEPRRLAARLAAQRVAAELGEAPGGRVGYQIRFDRVAGPETRLHYLTEGVLTRRLLADPDLRGAGVVVLDEFHERHLEGDVALALLRRLRRRRKDLRLVLMSATIEGSTLARELGNWRALRSEGRLFPVDIEFSPEEPLPLEERVSQAAQRLFARLPAGDVLCFLPGAAEIRRAQRAAQAWAGALGIEVLPLHGDLSPEEQDRAIAPSSRRKLILSTNVAESSITIEGVRAVIDSGLARLPVDSPWTGLPRIEVRRISQASARQRAGRAGRLGPGRAVRLYTEADFLRRPAHDTPEILRRELAQLALDLHAAGLKPGEVEWLDAPPEARWEEASDLLKRLGALSSEGKLTERGRRMARLPLHPRLACLAVAAGERGAGRAGCAAAALLAAGERLPGEAPHEALSDLDILLERPMEQRTKQLERQLVGLLRPVPFAGAAVEEETALRFACLEAFPDRVAARRRDRDLTMAGGMGAVQAANSTVRRAKLLVALEIEDRPEQGAPLVRLASAIEPEWLMDLFPEQLAERQFLEWNRESERVEACDALLYGDVVIEESRNLRPQNEAAAHLLARKAIETGMQRFVDAGRLEQLVERLRFLADHGLGPPVPDAILEGALTRLAQGCSSFSELERAAGNGGLEQSLLDEAGVAAHQVEQFAPERWRLPSGRLAKVTYKTGQPPWVASRLQDFFGLRETPKVAGGRVALVVHLLAPNQRPLQVTQDLSGFWRRLYPQVRKELMRRYPRHCWPEDPFAVQSSEKSR